MIPLLISAKMKSAHPPKQVKIQNMPPLPPSRPPPDWGKTLCSAKTFHSLIAELDFCKRFKSSTTGFIRNLENLEKPWKIDKMIKKRGKHLEFFLTETSAF